MVENAVQIELLKYKMAFSANVGLNGYIFKKQIEQAKSFVKNITTQTMVGNEKNDRQAHVIGIVGERGSGKTSFLKTLKDELENPKKPESKTVHILDIIDPGVISDSLSLIEMFIAKIYNDVVNENTPNEKIITALKNVVSVMADLKGGQNNFYIDVPNIAILDKINKRANFADHVKELVDLYLKSKEPKQNSQEKITHLVFLIDDLDMVYSKQVTSMLEDVRKYLPLNVITILAYRHNQLVANIMQDKINDNKLLIELKEVTAEEIKLQSVRYFEKLVPADYRISLLTQSELYLQPIWDLLDGCDETREFLGLNEQFLISFEDFVPEFIYQRTRIQIHPVSSKEKTANFLPKNLRGIMQLISILVNMKKIEVYCTQSKNEEIDLMYEKSYQNNIILENIMILKSYFMSKAVNEQDTMHAHVIETWESERLDRKNYNIYHQVRKLIAAACAPSPAPSQADKLNAMFDNMDTSTIEIYNVSIANVFTILELYKDTALSDEVFHFVYLIKVLYSVLILEQVIQAKSVSSFTQYQKIIGGKIIPDNFYYASRFDKESFYINISASQWKDISNENKELLNKMTYSKLSHSSGARTGDVKEHNFNKFRYLYNCDIKFKDCLGQHVPLDPFACVLKSDYLSESPAYIFYSLFDVDVILRTNYGRQKYLRVFKELCDLTTSYATAKSAGKTAKDDCDRKDLNKAIYDEETSGEYVSDEYVNNEDADDEDADDEEVNTLDVRHGIFIKKFMCNQIYTDSVTEKSQLNLIYKLEEWQKADELFVKSSRGVPLDIYDNKMIRSRNDALTYLALLRNKLSSPKHDDLMNVVDAVIFRIKTTPRIRLTFYDRNQIHILMKKYKLEVLRSEYDTQTALTKA